MMISYLQQVELVRLQHEERLAQAARERLLAQARRDSGRRLPSLFQWLAEQGRQWLAPQRSVTVDGITASRQQAY